ncbi:phage tail tape measure C-terminal domain-containing protein [Henriciella sp.]|uniref:phage tail tape measure C-terminal domain-containing protein n=1 Tax=Henriciella sp. TaxID=1968823 RepID=UPI00260F91AB|nr:phage tail tape measure C-terminal domain-containing protein [Henriciella sp.]
MDEVEESLGHAGAALRGLAEGPGREAAEALEQAFGDAGQSIEAALSRAARSGELDFGNMAQSVLGDLARIAAQAALAQAGTGQAGQAMTVNLSVGQGADAGTVVGAKSEISKAVAQAVSRGGRFI